MELALVGVTHGGARVAGRITARSIGDMPIAARVVVEVAGHGFRQRIPVDLRGADTPFAVALPDGDREPVVSFVRLDPDELLPRGVGEDGLVILDGPRLIASSPAEGELVERGLQEIVLEFDRPLQPVTIEEVLAARPPIPREARSPVLEELRFEDGGRRVEIGVRDLPPDKTWVLPLRGAWRGEWDDPILDAALTWRTDSSDDKTPPRIVSTDPVAGATGMSPDLKEVVVVFDEVMQRGVGFRRSTIEDLRSDGYGVPEMDFAWWDETSRILTVPITRLDQGVEYVLPIGYPLRDLSGNEVERFDLTFTTAEAGGP